MIKRLLRAKLNAVRKTFKFLIASTFLILMVSCKTIPIAAPSADSDFKQFLFKRIEHSNSDFFSCDQVELDISYGESRKLKAKIYLKKGDFIFASINFLGIEIGRAEISPDSIKIINRFDRTYYFGKIDDIKDRMNGGLSYYQIESLLLKGVVALKGENRKKQRSQFSEDGDFYIFNYQQSADRYVKSYYEKDSFKERKIEVVDRKSEFYLLCNLEDYENLNEYPEALKIKLKAKEFNADINISIGKISKAKFEKKSFAINSKYREMVF